MLKEFPVTNFLKLPLTNFPQTFQVPIGSAIYIFTIKWNDSPDGGWVLDISDATFNTPICANVPFVTAERPTTEFPFSILLGLEYLFTPNFALTLFTDGDLFAVPTYENLGTESNLYCSTDT